MLREGSEDRRKGLRARSPQRGQDANNLGGVLQDLGEMEKAKSCFERALKIDEKTFGLDHPSVATMANNLGLVLRDLGEMEKARECFERALKIDEKAFGLDHPSVAKWLTTSAWCCKIWGRWKRPKAASRGR